VAAASHRYPPHLILNFDESNWYLVTAGDEVVAESGAESVQNYVGGDAKANFSFFATLTIEGKRIPLVSNAKGKSNRSHKQFGRHDAQNFGIWHSASGRSTKILI
jgi:hypothetical protein